MKASRIFDNGFGDNFEVICDFVDWLSNPIWDVRVSKKPKGKRKFIPIVDVNSYRFTKIEPNKRGAYRLREYLKEIPWTWIEMVMDDVCAEIRKLGNELYPKDE